MNAPGESRIALVVGKKGSGKSRMLKRGLPLYSRPWVVWDVRGEYAGLPGARLWTDLAHFRAHLERGGDVRREVFACAEVQFPAWCRWVFKRGRLLVVVEELTRYCAAGKAPPHLADLFDRSRHARLDLVFTTAAIAEVPTSLRRQIDDLVLSRITLPGDVQYVRDWLGERLARRTRRLPPSTFLRVRTS